MAPQEARSHLRAFLTAPRNPGPKKTPAQGRGSGKIKIRAIKLS